MDALVGAVRRLKDGQRAAKERSMGLQMKDASGAADKNAKRCLADDFERTALGRRRWLAAAMNRGMKKCTMKLAHRFLKTKESNFKTQAIRRIKENKRRYGQRKARLRTDG